MGNKSKSSDAANFINSIEKRIKRVFNRDAFGTYDGIIEKVDLKNATLNVRVPSLGNILCENCPIMLPDNSDYAIIYPIFKVNSPVLITFKEFNLGKPVVIGFGVGTSLGTPMIENTICIGNGNNKITISNDTIKITNNVSSIIIDANGIRLLGNAITANGEDLTVDNEGAV